MSTAGKVLCVLIALPTLAWLWLASGVADTHREWGKRIVQLETDTEKTTTEIASTRSDVFSLKSQIDVAQRERDDRVIAARALVSQLSKHDTFTKETLDRYNLQNASVLAAVEASQRRLDARNTELAEVRNEITAAQTELAQLKERNTQDRATLTALREELKNTIAENKSLVERSKSSNSARGREPRVVGFAR